MAEAQRQCGDCSLCCKVLRIPELEKPQDHWCPNFAAGSGCRIYADRPHSCRIFHCAWLTEPTLGPEWKPSVSKMVLVSKTGLLAVHIDPTANRPWRTEPYYAVLKRLAAQGQKNQTVVLVVDRGRNIAILPDREVDLGYIDAKARISFETVNTANGPEWRLRVTNAGESEPQPPSSSGHD